VAYIKLKKLEFSNLFSYGKNNVINFEKNKISQLTAPNGSGKTSIAMILQETLFNKNIKSIKKNDLLNRWSSSKTWSSTLYFTTNSKNYEISVKRVGAQTKIQLLEEGVDISDHKVLDTYKKIQEIVGLDFEVFSQLTYQSSVDLLDFLKATDTNRKKFLINLFNLEKYVNIGETIKVKLNTTDKELAKISGELKSIEDFLNNVVIPEKQTEKAVPDIDESLQQRIGVLDEQLKNYFETCKKIDKNNLYIKERENLRFKIDMPAPLSFDKFNEYTDAKNELRSIQQDIARWKKEMTGLDTNDTCPACGQSIDNSHATLLIHNNKAKIINAENNYNEKLTQVKEWSDEIKEIETQQKRYELNQSAIEKFESLSQIIDNSTPVEYPDVDMIQKEKKELLEKYKIQKAVVDEIVEFNKQVGVNNAKVEALEEQKTDFINRQALVKNDTLVLQNSLNNLNILKKAFSTSGIVAFKLENLTKELQNSINYYLSLLSDGQFQVKFTLDREKLNIIVVNNGVSTPIETVSGGEFSRIQTAILLAIRNLLSKLGGSSINLLFLDEITGVLDDEGKEKLIEVLQIEENLNVFLISHDFTHPLIDQIQITKNNNISSIEV
jgi:DNA repair exonuclease SbcCD ATPase subunit